MDQPIKETVIVVHGTWAAPDPQKAQWYQHFDAEQALGFFVGKLDAALQERGSPARCWAHCGDGGEIFHWSGENSWLDRTKAAAALGDYVAKLQHQGWRCHIVAHSHGGNVVVEALPQIAAAPDTDRSPGKIVTMGTPFMDTISPISKKVKWVRRVLNAFSWVGLVVFVVLSAGYMVHVWQNEDFAIQILTSSEPLSFKAYIVGNGIIALGAFVLLLAWIFRLIIRKVRGRSSWREPQPDTAPALQPQLLALGSAMDEPWQILHHMQSIVNPLAAGPNLIGYLVRSAQAQISQSVEVARIHGAKSFRDLKTLSKFWLAVTYAILIGANLICFRMLYDGIEASDDTLIYGIELWVAQILFLFGLVLFLTRMLGVEFYSAFLAPFRWCIYSFNTIINIFTDTATYFVRRRGWSVVLGIAMGLEGYRYGLPTIYGHPAWLPNDRFEARDIPQSAVRRACEKRRGWINNHLADVEETFSKMIVTGADIAALLRKIESDQSLVHAAYYTDEDCIAKIADWIAGDGWLGDAAKTL
jgi:hypothetical protein